MQRNLLIFLIYFQYVNSVKINIFAGILGPWREIEINTKNINGSIIKRGFVSKIHFIEDEEIDEDEQVETINNMAGLTELEIKGIGQLKVPLLSNLRLIKTIKITGNYISEVHSSSLRKVHPKSIDLSSNKIARIEKDSFGHSLETLILSCNQLKTVTSEWFEEPENLQHLILTGNQIKIIPSDFERFSNLLELRASFNKIINIEDRSLAQNIFTYIDLSYNNLTTFKDSSFTKNLVEIMYLNLRANRLNFLSENFMRKVNVTVELTADLNPWLCPCNDVIRKWLPKIVLYNKKNSWLDAQALDHAHRKDVYCVKDEWQSTVCFYKVDLEATDYYFNNIEPFDVKVCQDY